MTDRTQCTIHCFRCDKEMKVERNEDGYMDFMLSNGLFFHASGNYGSTVYDPIRIARSSREFLEIVICDDCIVKHQNNIDHVRVKSQRDKHEVALFEVDKE